MSDYLLITTDNKNRTNISKIMWKEEVAIFCLAAGLHSCPTRNFALRNHWLNCGTEISVRNTKFLNQISSRYAIIQIKLIFNPIILINSFFVCLFILKPILPSPFAWLRPYQLFSFPFFISSRYCILPYSLDARILLFLFLAANTDDIRVLTHEKI